jgi:aspartate carbamoyltransferase catalytic subunit
MSAGTGVAVKAATGASSQGGQAAWQHRHLIDLDVVSWPEIELIMRTTTEMKGILARPIRKVPALNGRRVTTLFYEASTRTRVSFETAARNLSADVVSIATGTSSVTKGESLVDTIRTLEALGAEILVMRHAVSGAPYLAAEVFGGHVLNGGDGWHAHPTQALLDLYTMREHVGPDLRGRKVAIVGDILHSRVARSNIWSLTAAGADLWLCGPATLLRGMERWAGAWSGGKIPGHGRFNVTTDIDAALRDADVVMALRIQRERMQGGLLPSLREYAARFQVNAARVSLARPEAIVMHPGPMNEGVEIAPDVAISGRAVITEQVANGVAARMALLYLLAGVHDGHASEVGHLHPEPPRGVTHSEAAR